MTEVLFVYDPFRNPIARPHTVLRLSTTIRLPMFWTQRGILIPSHILTSYVAAQYFVHHRTTRISSKFNAPTETKVAPPACPPERGCSRGSDSNRNPQNSFSTRNLRIQVHEHAFVTLFCCLHLLLRLAYRQFGFAIVVSRLHHWFSPLEIIIFSEKRSIFYLRMPGPHDSVQGTFDVRENQGQRDSYSSVITKKQVS